MKKEKVLEVTTNIKNLLDEKYPEILSERHTGNIKNEKEKIEHLKYISSELIERIENDFENKKGKIFRHLAFLQGVMWTLGLQSVDDLKRANMPDGKKFRDDV